MNNGMLARPMRGAILIAVMPLRSCAELQNRFTGSSLLPQLDGRAWWRRG